MKKINNSALMIVLALTLCCAMLVGCGQRATQFSEMASPAAIETTNAPAANATATPSSTAGNMDATSSATTGNVDATSSATAGNVDAASSATAGNVDAASSATIKNEKASSSAHAAGTNTADIGVEEARRIALQHAGVTASSVTFARTEKDHDDGRLVYEIEFYSQNKEYDYEIDASTGAIVNYDHDAEHYTMPAATGDNNANYIGIEKAKSIALKHAGLSASEVSFSKAKFEDDNGRKEYEVEFYHSGKEYEYTIDASSGAIVEYDSERDD